MPQDPWNNPHQSASGDPGLVPDTVSGEVPPELRQATPANSGCPSTPTVPDSGSGTVRPYGVPAGTYPSAPAVAPPYGVPPGARPPVAYGDVPAASRPIPPPYMQPVGSYSLQPATLPGAAAGQRTGAGIWIDFVKLHSRRAVSRNMRTVQPTSYEEPRLAAPRRAGADGSAVPRLAAKLALSAAPAGHLQRSSFTSSRSSARTSSRSPRSAYSCCSSYSLFRPSDSPSPPRWRPFGGTSIVARGMYWCWVSPSRFLSRLPQPCCRCTGSSLWTRATRSRWPSRNRPWG